MDLFVAILGQKSQKIKFDDLRNFVKIKSLDKNMTFDAMWIKKETCAAFIKSASVAYASSDPQEMKLLRCLYRDNLSVLSKKKSGTPLQIIKDPCQLEYSSSEV